MPNIPILTIPTLTLNNGIKIPQLGLGTYLISNELAPEFLQKAFDIGYRLIDTADAYDNEEGVGKAIRISGLPRSEIFVTSKVWNNQHGYKNTINSFETSLRKLNLDYMDLFLIHWPCPQKGLYVETWKALENLYKEGLVKSIGLSNFNSEHIDRILEESEVVPAVLQIEIHPTFTQSSLRQYAKKQGIAVESWYPLGGQSGKEGLLNLPLFGKLGKKYSKTPAQIILRWHIQLGLIVIPKSSKPERLKENCNIFDFEMTNDEMDSISALNKNARLGFDPNTFC